MVTTTGMATRRTKEITQKARVSRTESRSAEQGPASASASIADLEDLLASRILPRAGKDAARELASTIVCTAKVAVPSSVAACKPKSKKPSRKI
jgi:hypothetical protein